MARAAKPATPIRKPGQRPPRFLIYGRNKQGKTTFAGSAPNVLILDPESGAEELHDGVDIWPINTWTDMNEAYRFLSKNSHPYEWIAIDGLTRINNMALRYTMKLAEERDLDRRPGMVDRRDYNKSGELMKGMLFNFHNLHNVGITFTAQDRMDGDFQSDLEDDDEDADVAARFVPDLPKGVRSSVSAIVDVIGRIYTQKVTGRHPKTKEEVTVRQRRLWLATSEQYDTGYRSKFKNIPTYLKNPTVPRLEALIRKGEL